MSKTFDAIIVGARVAGSAAAILLARDKRRVLLIDKDAFPSDRLSTHIVLGGGAKVLGRMGMLEMLERAGGVRFERMRAIGPDFNYGGELARDGADDRGLCLGRTLMDAAMIDAARSFESVEFRERLRLTDLIIEDGAVLGIRGEDASGVHEFRAPLTIGADGMRSSVAQIASERIDAFKRVDVPCARAYYYAYFEGVRAQTARRRSRHGIRIGTRRRQPGLSMRERTDSRGDRVRRRRDANLSHRPRIQPASAT